MDIGSIEVRKRELRSSLKRLRNGLGDVRRRAADERIRDRVLALPEYRRADVILPYLSFGSEADTRAIIHAAWGEGKTVAIPRCVPGTRRMRWYRVSSLEGLERSAFGVEEPVPTKDNEQQVNADNHMLAIVPALTFDPAGYRLGYGGGYYDTFLTAFGGTSVGICHDALISGDLRAEGVVAPHDLPVQFVVTDARTFGKRMEGSI